MQQRTRTDSFLSFLVCAELYNREALHSAKRISNPGCFATNTQLLLAPLLPYMSAPPSVHAISGYSGAGTKSGKEPKITPESLQGGVRPYALTDHIHEREAGYQLSKLLDASAHLKKDEFNVAFMPNVAPWFQGIISTVSIPLKQEMRASEIKQLFEDKYGDEKLVQVQSGVPEIAQISGKHGVRIGGFQVHSSGKRVVIVVSTSYFELFLVGLFSLKFAFKTRVFSTTFSRALPLNAFKSVTSLTLRHSTRTDSDASRQPYRTSTLPSDKTSMRVSLSTSNRFPSSSHLADTISSQFQGSSLGS